MVLVDTSIWIDHFRKGDEVLRELLCSAQVFMHDFIMGELSLGNFSNRNTIMQMLKDLPKATMAAEEEVIMFIEKHKLYGLGIGYIDAHLLASAFLANVHLYTKDKKLKDVALNLRCAYVKH